MSRSFGCSTEWVDGLWVNRSPSPPYYPNAVTLGPGGSAATVGFLRSMRTWPLGRPWSVKDSFRRLDLMPLGFGVLFEAEWIGLAAADPLKTATSDTTPVRVRHPGDLVAWEGFWRSANPDAETSDVRRMFRPSLLHDPDIRFLTLARGARTVAVAIANRSNDGSESVVGISNIVLADGDREMYRAGLVASVRDAFPGLPVVGYEQGDDLVAMRDLGFLSLGLLRVWLSAG